ncbi:MAG: DUF4384 domain-containing protein [Blastocatellia bacterium]
MRNAAIVRFSIVMLLVLLFAGSTPWLRAKVGQKSGSTSVWTEETQVERKPKAGRKPVRPRPKAERVRLLTLEYRVFKREQDGEQIEVNPLTTFHTRDRVRMAIKPNQDGYLYIINQTEDQRGKVVDAPRLIFPDSRIKGGQNFVKMNEEIILPGFCPRDYVDDQGRCWWWMNQEVGSEVIIFIFSRDLITDLQDNTSGGVVKADYIAQLKASSGERIKRSSRPGISPEQGGGAGGYTIWVTNTNTKDNEELIETVSLNHTTESQAYQ